MNLDLILTVLGLSITVVLVSPFYIAIALAYHKAKMSAELEAIKKHGRMFHPSNDDINWEDIFEGEK